MIFRRGCCCIVEDILIELPPFRLDVENERLWRGRAIIPLNPKSFALLRYLVENHGRLITKRELLDAVWRDTFVTEGVLKTCIKEIRRALNDDADAPRFIETAHRRGYRFVGGQSPDSPETVLAARAPVRAPLLVGRDSVLDELAAHLESAEQGQRRVVFVTGEPGAGKTTVIEAFLAAQANTGLLIVRGQCLEQYGEAEPFLPVLEAFGQLSVPACRSKFIEILHTHAPTWLVQMPALIAREERERLQKELFGATRQRMMREMTDGLDAFSAETPFVLALEDLHWCDPSTVDLITSLARRVNPARFMLLGTYRPVEIALSRHPLREVTQDLLSRRLCHNVALDCLSEASIEEYLTARFKVADLLADRATLARRLHRHTGGNPLFLVNLVDYLEARDALNMPDVQIGLPETLRQMITRQVERLKETDQRMIEAGAVAGADFDAAAVATAVGITSDLVEECCDELVAKGMFLKKAEHPGGVRSRSLARYSFIHALYRECLYERIQASRRQRWHQAIGEWQEAGGMDPAELASELAVHFEASGDLHRAIHYLKLAAAGAAARFAFVEGRQCLDRAAKLAQSLPGPERGMVELELFDQRRMFRAAGAITPDQSEMFEATLQDKRGA